jgi:hypothetical protein
MTSGRVISVTRWWLILGFSAASFACGATSPDTDEDSDGPVVYPSTFTTGKFRATSLTLLPAEQGLDQDGDGTVDNNLPFALTTADSVVRDLDLSPTGIQAQIDTSIADNDLNLLVSADYLQGLFTLAVLSGSWDETTGTYTADAAGFGSDGKPLSLLDGTFLDQTAFEAGSDQVLVPLTFIAGEPPALVPVRRARWTGSATPDSVDGMLTGVLPAVPLAEDVLAPLIPEEGVGNLTKEQLLGALRTFAGLETIADIDLGNGERGVSCALQVSAPSQPWEAP